MKKILVPTDYSGTSKNAVDYALQLSMQIKAQVILLHVFDVPVAVTDFPVIIASVEELEKENIALLKKYEEELKEKYGKDIFIKSIVKTGFVFDAIEDVIHTEKPDLIVMGITGAGKIAELLIGSNATRVMQKTTTPSIIVPEGVRYHAIKKIAFACDYKEVEESKAVDKLVDFVKLFDAELMVINIGEHKQKHSYSKELSGRLLTYIFENANESIDVPSSLDYSLHKRKDEDIVHGINTFIDRHKADLLVMIPRKHNILASLFHESNTKKMAFHSHIPLLALHEEV